MSAAKSSAVLFFRHCTLAYSHRVHIMCGALIVVLAMFLVALPGPVYAAGSEVMLGGYDPVSYFSTDGPKLGSKRFLVEHNGLKYAFRNEANAARFRSNPDRFSPQFDGNCAFGMAFGSKSSVDPTVWKIVNGKLYFHINAGTQTAWSKKRDSYIKRAETAWETIR